MWNRPRKPRPVRFVKARLPDQAPEFFAAKFSQLFLSMGRHSTTHIDATSADAVVVQGPCSNAAYAGLTARPFEPSGVF